MKVPLKTTYLDFNFMDVLYQKIFTYLCFDRQRIDLAHVRSSILQSDSSNVQTKFASGRIMRYSDPLVVTYDMFSNGLNGFGISLDPTHLKMEYVLLNLLSWQE